jgi:hypothetical protein
MRSGGQQSMDDETKSWRLNGAENGKVMACSHSPLMTTMMQSSRLVVVNVEGGEEQGTGEREEVEVITSSNTTQSTVALSAPSSLPLFSSQSSPRLSTYICSRCHHHHNRQRVSLAGTVLDSTEVSDHPPRLVCFCHDFFSVGRRRHRPYQESVPSVHP